MMVRVAGLAGQVRRQIEEVSIDGLTPPQQLAAIRDAYRLLEQGQQEVWRELRGLLAGKGIDAGRHRAGWHRRWRNGCATIFSIISCR